MVYFSPTFQRGSRFSALLRERDLWCRLAGFRHRSTQTAHQLPGMEYQDAICTLNTLQTNASALEQVRLERNQPQQQLQAMEGFLERAGLTVEELNRLNIIHVTGTKGKGSTCAFTEKILRSYGFRTGFYSSPHLVQVRERIRINGQPIGKDIFTKYFWQIYGRLEESKQTYGGTMPAYFRFLTILAFHVFLQEKVDVAVIEVGIGGAYDCTNIIRKPWVCGVSSLGIDHTQILGDTIEKIAWQKGGIFKVVLVRQTLSGAADSDGRHVWISSLHELFYVWSHHGEIEETHVDLEPQPGVPAFTVKQPEGAMAVLRDRAKEIKCPLWVCPDLGDYQTDGTPFHLGLAGKHQHSNASLALQLSNSWLKKRCSPDKSLPAVHRESIKVHQAPSFRVSSEMVMGLADTEWPGRNQTLKSGKVAYFLDGAHTVRSMQACVDWFQVTAAQHERNASGPVTRVLLFNATGDRDSAAMLKLLVPCHFDFAVFCPNITEVIASCSADQQNFNVSVENMLTRCMDNERSWRLHNCGGDKEGAELLIEERLQPVPETQVDTLVFPCILSALQWITQGRDPVLADPDKQVLAVKPNIRAKAAILREAAEIHVLITGSLHLVGGVLKHLNPKYSN